MSSTSVPILWQIEPPSKNAVCKFSYRFEKSLPTIFAIPIKVTSGKNRKPILSQRRRREAILKFTKSFGKELEINSALQFRVAKNENSKEEPVPVDRILFLSVDSQPDGEVPDLVKKITKGEKILDIRKFKVSDGEIQSENTYCTCARATSFTPGTDDDGYWKMLDTLIKTFMSTTNVEGATYTRSGELLLTSVPSNIAIKEAHNVSTFLRLKPKLDPNQRKLHLELDLVPSVKKELYLSELILSIFGRALVGRGIHYHLSDIRGMLTGLVVSRDYQPLDSEGSGSTKDQLQNSDLHGTNFTKSSPAKAGGQSRDAPSDECIIRDIQLSGNVPSFLDANGKRYSVVRYFEQVLNKIIHHPSLPLAKIGSRSWVPLEMLKAHHTQTLYSSTLSTGLLQDFQKSNDVDVETKKLRDVADGIIAGLNCVRTRPRLVHVDKQTSKPFSNATEQMSVPGEVSDCKTLQVTNSQSLSIGIIYVASATKPRNDAAEFATNVDRRIHATSQKLKDDEEKPLNILNFNQKFRSSGQLTATITDIKPLLLADSRGASDVHAFRTRMPSTILAIVDTDGRTKSEVRNIQAELYKFGNRKIGAVTHCTTRQSLEKLFDDHKAVPDYFPVGLLWKFNSMHGGQNFKVNPVEETDLMIIGAHISHPGSDASENCPSVASVVSNLDNARTTYPGSVRLQVTLRSVETRKNRFVHHVESKILLLEDMMLDRCMAWKKKNNNVAPRVVFYRDGLTIVQNNVLSTEVKAIVVQEIQAILRAMQTIFPKDEQSLTYILVNKRGDSPYGSDLGKTFSDAGIIKFSAEESKHEYLAMPRIGKESRREDKLGVLTQSLNANYQLSQTANPSVALPVYFAQKLALRTFDYFRFAVTNEYDSVSSVLRRARHPASEAEKNDQETTTLIKEYLFGGPANDSLDNDASGIDVSNRKDPWPESLDDTMFYL